MKKLLFFASLLLLTSFALPAGDKNEQPFERTFYNQENQITIALDLYDTTLVAPNYSFLGKLNGYMTGRLYDVWFVTDFKIKKGKATVRFSNDLGSDEQEICFTFDKNGQLLYETVGNNVIRRAENRKWIKLPTKMLFVSKDSKAKKP